MWTNSHLDPPASAESWVREEGSAEGIGGSDGRAFPTGSVRGVFTGTRLEQTVPSGRECNLWGDEPSLAASFFGFSRLPSPASVLGLHRPSLCATCAYNPRISLPFLINWGSSTIVGPYCTLEVTQRFSKVEDLEPYSLRQLH